jgi:hypothetical protein
MDMVERVARALADEARFIYERDTERWDGAARAAIGAMREPTPDMTWAAFEQALVMDFKPAWYAAIDSILKSTRETA